MASYTCPKCEATLKKGSWELYTHCPECGEAWTVDPNASGRNLRRSKTLAVLFSVFSLIPYLGIVFGFRGVFWGMLAVRFRYVALGTTAALVSGIIGIGCQPALA